MVLYMYIIIVLSVQGSHTKRCSKNSRSLEFYTQIPSPCKYENQEIRQYKTHLYHIKIVYILNFANFDFSLAPSLLPNFKIFHI